METTNFRFQTAEEYLRAMTNLIQAQQELETDSDKEYEELAEEYILFCNKNDEV